MAEALWSDVAAAYDRSFASLCAGTADNVLTRLPPAAEVLDVGCGSGFLTAALVDAGHVVHAVDPDPEMLELATTRSVADFRRAGLPDLPYPATSFDAIVANFVLNHVDDPRAAARELARVTRPDGTVVATIWPGSLQPQMVMWNSVVDASGAERRDMPRLAPELDFERSPDRLGALLAEAGLGVVETTLTEFDWRVRPADFLAGATRVGNFGVLWRAQSPDVQERMAAAFDEAAAAWLDGEHLVFPVRAAIVRATA